MPYDPNFPPNNAVLESLPFRNQFQGLKSLIDVIQTLSAAQVDGVTTLNPGDPAGASVMVSGDTLHFTFAIPRGAEGVQGIQGITGVPGSPFAQAIVDAVNTLNPGDSATVSVSFDGTNVHFTFSIPRGNDGVQGLQGIPGTNGTDGAPGEVTNAQLTTAVNGSSSNTNAVATLGLVVSDPPTQAELQSVANKMDELILALRR